MIAIIASSLDQSTLIVVRQDFVFVVFAMLVFLGFLVSLVAARTALLVGTIAVVLIRVFAGICTGCMVSVVTAGLDQACRGSRIRPALYGQNRWTLLTTLFVTGEDRDQGFMFVLVG